VIAVVAVAIALIAGANGGPIPSMP